MSDVLGYTEVNTMQEIEFISVIMNSKFASEKQSMVGVLCKDSVGNKFVVEVELTRDKDFEKRIQYYVAKASQGNLVDIIIYTKDFLYYNIKLYFISR